MPIVGGLDIHRKQITFDYFDTETGQVCRGQISPADREHLRAWLARFAGRDDVAFAVEGCTGWRYVAEELAAAWATAHLAEPADTAFATMRHVPDAELDDLAATIDVTRLILGRSLCLMVRVGRFRRPARIPVATRCTLRASDLRCAFRRR
jgi:hypothetical protein